MNEKDYIMGQKAAYDSMLQNCLKNLDFHFKKGISIEKRIVQLVSERTQAILVLRTLCEKFGDNNWDDSLHLSDIIEKHLERHLERHLEIRST